MTEKERNHQIKKEAIVSLCMYAAFFLWWYFTGYGLAGDGNSKPRSYILGLPTWFFLSSIVGYILFSVATILVVKLIFKDMPLGELEDGKEAESK